ncbi:MAG TPA: DUF5666 domain-containing protein [Candidatus Pacearchaeota archaeon]|nr:DUF5666 domain-containing protein [Candidatus Pacearchaeota archaeon]
MKQNNQLKIIGIIIALIVVIAASFYGGMVYGQNKKSNRSNFQNMANMNNGNINNGTNGQKMIGNTGIANGEIASQDDKSFIVKLSNGSSKIIFFSNSTKVFQTTEGALSDLKVGDKVMVNGTANQDGSITAKTIQLNPIVPIGNSPSSSNPAKQGQPSAGSTGWSNSMSPHP